MASLQTPNPQAGYAPATGSERPEPITAGLDELTTAVSRAQTFTSASGAAVAVLNGEALVCCAGAGTMGPGIGGRLSLQGIAGACVRSGKEIRCDDSESDARVDGAECRSWNARSILAVPVHEGEAVTGAILAFSGIPNAFTQVHLAILKTLADQLRGLREKAAVSAAGLPSASRPETPVAPAPAPESSRETQVSMAPTPLTLSPTMITERAPKAGESRSDRVPTAEFEIKSVLPPPAGKIPAVREESVAEPPVTALAASGPPAAKSDTLTAAVSFPLPPASEARIDPPPTKPVVASPAARRSEAPTPKEPVPTKVGTPAFVPMARPPAQVPTPPPFPATVSAVPGARSKERVTEVLPPAADPIDLNVPLRPAAPPRPPALPRQQRPARPSPSPRPETATFTGNFAALEDAGNDGSRLSLLLVVVLVLALGLGGWGFHRVLRRSPRKLTEAAQPTTLQPSAEPVDQAATAVEVIPPATQPAPPAAATPIVEMPVKQPAAVEVAVNRNPATAVEAREPKIPVVTETVPATDPTEASSTVLRVPAHKTEVVEAPKVATAVPAPLVPVMAAPVTVVNAAAHSTGATPAQLLVQTKPVYPIAAKMMHAQGSVTLSVKISKDGKVDEVKWVGGNTLFKEAAITAVRDWKYKPATLDGQATESTQDVVLKFTPQ